MTTGIGGSTIATELQVLQRWSTTASPIATTEYLKRIERAQRLMADNKVDALVVSAGSSLRYFTGVPWCMIERFVAVILPVSGAPVFICPVFEIGSLDAVLLVEMDVLAWEEHESPFQIVAIALQRFGAQTVGLDPTLPFSMANALRAISGATDFIDASAIVDGCRSRKSSNELALLRHAKQMTLEVQRRAARILAPGISASTVRHFIDDAHRALGAAGSSFCLVHFGHSTSFPHGLPEDDVLAEGDMVLIDTGCTVHGYNSDITRSYVFAMWTLEKDAQTAAFEAVRPGVLCSAIDAVARAVLERGGLGPGYNLPGLPHRTGHGIGLSVHEAPYLVRGDDTPLAPGMCFSNEPTIIVPGKFGIRLEDHFYVTATGAEWFTQPSPSIDQPFA
jgi:Xaa-Pro dipeptidase